MRSRIAVVLKGYPRLSETFIAQELLALERAGLTLSIFSLRKPTDAKVHPVHREIAASVSYLPEYLHEQPLRVLKAWWKARRLPGYRRARATWLSDLRRDPTRNRVRRFGQALVLAIELPRGIDRLYSHFIHTPGSVTRYASLLTGLPWSCSAHAKDIWTTPDWELAGKLDSAEWTVTCTQVGRDRLASLAADAGSVHLSYHGVDLERFPRFTTARRPRDGRDAADPVRLLSVGRAVEKKGFDLLLAALAQLPRDLAWSWTHIGGGERLATLRQQAAQLDIATRLRFLGAQAQEAVLAEYRAADLFVLPCRIAEDGDRDGLPNVLMEAQSQGLCCVSTRVSSIPELILEGSTGLLVPPDDPGALAVALREAIGDPALRSRLGAAGEARVRSAFDHEVCTDGILALIGRPSRHAAMAEAG